MARKLISVREFAAQIGRSVRHVERLISDGEGPPIVRVGVRAIAIDEVDADNWIESRRQIAPAQTLRAARVEGAEAALADGVAPPRRGPGRPRKAPAEVRETAAL